MVLSAGLLSLAKHKDQEDLGRIVPYLVFPHFAAAIQSQPDPKPSPVHPVFSSGILYYHDPAV